jgi:hypothetical protein
VGYFTSNRLAAVDHDGKDFYFVYNPTYEEVRAILAEKELNSVDTYVEYTSINGIHMAYVRCQTVPDSEMGWVYLYELIGFDTVDNGFIIIDPVLHREVEVEVGTSYSLLNNLPAGSFDDTIGKMTVVW